jgi:hypothetical protein
MICKSKEQARCGIPWLTWHDALRRVPRPGPQPRSAARIRQENRYITGRFLSRGRHLAG